MESLLDAQCFIQMIVHGECLCLLIPLIPKFTIEVHDVCLMESTTLVVEALE